MNKSHTILSKLPSIGESIFATMTKLALEHNAINLSQGFPDFPCDPIMIELVHQMMKDGHNQYAPMPGVMRLKEQISKKINDLYNININPADEITITAGATQALFTVINALIQSGDEVIVLEPAYDSYSPAVIAAGGVSVPIPLIGEEFKPDWGRIEKVISPRTTMIITNTPHNPTGSVLNRGDIEQLKTFALKHDLYILSDEVYEHIVFDDIIHHSILSHLKDLPKAIAVFSFGKTFHATGWKVGYVICNKPVMTEIRKIHQFTVFAVNTPVQYAYASYLEDASRYLSLGSFYQEKRDKVISLISNSSFKLAACKGTYFQLLDYSSVSDMDDVSFSQELVKRFGVAVIPLSPFYSSAPNNKYIRICFAKKNYTLEEGIKRLIIAAETFGKEWN